MNEKTPHLPTSERYNGCDQNLWDGVRYEDRSSLGGGVGGLHDPDVRTWEYGSGLGTIKSCSQISKTNYIRFELAFILRELFEQREDF